LTRGAAACQVKREHLCAAMGGFDEAERSERGGAVGGGPKGEANPFRVPMIALAQAGFARRSQIAGGFGNPFRVPMIALA